MAITIRELAGVCGADILGNNPQQTIDSAANLDEAGAHQLTFLGSPKYAGKLKTTTASAVLVPKGTPGDGAHADTCLLVVDDPEMAFITCLHRLYPQKASAGTLSAKAHIDPAATLGAGTCVEAFASIGARTTLGSNCWVMAGCRIGDGVTLGNNCVLHPNVVLYDGVRLGDNVILHAGTVIGSDGFGYKFRNGEHVKFPQVGTVVIESNVEIGANTCIDRAALGETRVGEGTKIDNQVHIAHNVQIGARSLLCGQVGIGGSTRDQGLRHPGRAVRRGRPCHRRFAGRGVCTVGRDQGYRRQGPGDGLPGGESQGMVAREGGVAPVGRQSKGG